MTPIILITDHHCPNCGGDMHGDGYITPVHCERVHMVHQIDQKTDVVYSISDIVYCTDAHD